MTLDDELTRLEQRVLKYGHVIIPRALRERIVKFLPVKSEAHAGFLVDNSPISVSVDERFITNMTAELRRNIARLTAEKLTK